jgi:hypothetical protein
VKLTHWLRSCLYFELVSSCNVIYRLERLKILCSHSGYYEDSRLLDSCAVWLIALMMEAVRTFETSVKFPSGYTAQYPTTKYLWISKKHFPSRKKYSVFRAINSLCFFSKLIESDGFEKIIRLLRIRIRILHRALSLPELYSIEDMTFRELTVFQKRRVCQILPNWVTGQFPQ